LEMISIPPIAKPASQEPVISPEITTVSIDPIIRHETVFAMCLL